MKHAGQRRPAPGCVSRRTQERCQSLTRISLCAVSHYRVLPPSQILAFLTHSCMHTHTADGGRSRSHISSCAPLASQEPSGERRGPCSRGTGNEEPAGQEPGQNKPTPPTPEPQPLFHCSQLPAVAWPSPGLGSVSLSPQVGPQATLGTCSGCPVIRSASASALLAPHSLP